MEILNQHETLKAVPFQLRPPVVSATSTRPLPEKLAALLVEDGRQRKAISRQRTEDRGQRTDWPRMVRTSWMDFGESFRRRFVCSAGKSKAIEGFCAENSHGSTGFSPCHSRAIATHDSQI